MNILFIIPPHIKFEDFVTPSQNHRQIQKADGKTYGNLITDMPLGPLSMSGYLKEHCPDVNVDLLDFNVLLNRLTSFQWDNFYDYFTEIAKEKETIYDLIGISSLFSPSYYSTLDIAKAFKAFHPESLIVAGGNIPSTMYKRILSTPDNAIDAICYGEGELPMLDLIKNGKSIIESSSSWITNQKINSTSEFTPEHNFIWELDQIPMYDYPLCKDNYFENPAFTTYGVLKKKSNSAHVMTSRGCPFKCIFCASHKVHGRKMRYYSIERVKKEFLYLRENMGVETLIFQDDHLMGDKKRAQEIIRFVGEIGCKAVFQNSLALYALNYEMLETIKSAGINQLVLSVESGSDRVLKKVMKKPLKLSIVQQVTEDCRKLDIYTYANILIGLPGETKKDIEDARVFLRSTGANWFGIFCATPLVGSEMHEICDAGGNLDDAWIGSDYKTAAIHTEEWTSEYIQEMTYLFNLELNFVFNSDLRLENYKTALSGFERAISSKNDHAFAWLYGAYALLKLGELDRSREYFLNFKESSKDQFWQAHLSRYDSEMAPLLSELEHTHADALYANMHVIGFGGNAHVRI